MYGIRIWGAVGVFRQEFNYLEGMGAAAVWKGSRLFFLLLLLISISGKVIVALFGISEWHLVQQREDAVATSLGSMKRRNTFSSHSDTKYTQLSNEPACIHSYNPVTLKDVNISYTLHAHYKCMTSEGRLYCLDCILLPLL